MLSDIRSLAYAYIDVATIPVQAHLVYLNQVYNTVKQYDMPQFKKFVLEKLQNYLKDSNEVGPLARCERELMYTQLLAESGLFPPETSVVITARTAESLGFGSI